ncbi:acyl carrier protein [Spartinivicinus poritis]|uniref:Acyl carrier protein n=1 Tax=Spartinivicinus poritis TaxID=2994640 RepID=A0ABT5UAT3_9GAMM|nr:acyl carrier protein [Spartinivicinus sp. A2-2]MDE1462568.1 acyl carrier protein [Spartinivicinus sp. A2-2]
MKKTDVFNLVQNNILEILVNVTEADIRPEISMRDIGANSIDRADVVVMCLADLSLKIPLVKFAGLKTIGELVDLLYAEHQTKEVVE